MAVDYSDRNGAIVMPSVLGFAVTTSRYTRLTCLHRTNTILNVINYLSDLCLGQSARMLMRTL